MQRQARRSLPPSCGAADWFRVLQLRWSVSRAARARRSNRIAPVGALEDAGAATPARSWPGNWRTFSRSATWHRWTSARSGRLCGRLIAAPCRRRGSPARPGRRQDPARPTTARTGSTRLVLGIRLDEAQKAFVPRTLVMPSAYDHRCPRQRSCRPGPRPPRPRRSGPGPGSSRTFRCASVNKAPVTRSDPDSPMAPGIAAAAASSCGTRFRTALYQQQIVHRALTHATPRRTASASRSPRHGESVARALAQSWPAKPTVPGLLP